MKYVRNILIIALIHHQRLENGGGCSCGFNIVGGSFAEHIADMYEKLSQDLHAL